MDLVFHNQVTFEELTNEKINYLICAVGYENRCTYISKNLSLKNIEKFALAYNESMYSNERLFNYNFFKSHNFKIYETENNSTSTIIKILTEIKNQCYAKHINILIDYSCMPRLWIAAIFEFLYKYDISAEKISLYFAYIPRKFNHFIKSVDLISENLLFKFTQKIKNNLPIALIISANPYIKNYEKLISSFNPNKIYIFLPEFYYLNEQISLDNFSYKFFNDYVDKKETVFYNLLQLNELYANINSLILNLRNKFKIIIIPAGPKPFTLITLLLTYQYPDIEIHNWLYRIKDNGNHNKGEPTGLPIITKVVFVPEYVEDNDI